MFTKRPLCKDNQKLKGDVKTGDVIHE